MGLAVAVAAAVIVLAGAAPAFAGRSATGKPAFYPCDRCHPVSVDAAGNPTKTLPVGLKRHEIALEVHDTLGTGGEACLQCHDAPTANPGKLKAPDGSLIDITGDVSRVCQRCHFEKYREWKAGIHGKGMPKCSASGCHDPHTPSWIYIGALPPFSGTGTEVHAVGADRVAFRPLAPPPPPAPVTVSLWLVIVAALGAVAAAGTVAFLVLGRSER